MRWFRRSKCFRPIRRSWDAIPLPEAALPVLTPRPIGRAAGIGRNVEILTFRAGRGFEKDAAHDDWADIQVPGEWVMQGFKVQPNTPAAYFRTFTLAAKPAGQRFKLRFSAVYSLCRVWLNGIEVGGHEGGFVPFEFDVTDAIKAGANTLAVSVQSESLLDKLSCGSQYACHPLGRHHPQGAAFQRAGSPSFRPQNRDHVRQDIPRRHACREARDSQPVGSTFLPDRRPSTIVPLANSAKVDVAPTTVKWTDLAPGETRNGTVRIAVKNPAKWDNEHPHLYKLVIAAKDSAGNAETVEETFRLPPDRGSRQSGLRQRNSDQDSRRLPARSASAAGPGDERGIVEEGRRNLPRGQLQFHPHFALSAGRGVSRRSATGSGCSSNWRRRCAGSGTARATASRACPSDEAIFQRLAQANLETVQGYPNHPSVIMRSMANESSWSPLFARVHQAVRKADPTRPCTFHDQCWGNDNNAGSKEMPIAVMHYPGLEGPAMCAGQSRPVHFGEYCHLESYNRRELATDPGLRDLWGPGLDLMWGKMRTAPGCFGGSIWSGIDDTFFLPERRDRRLRHLGADRRLAAAEAGVLAYEEGLFAGADSRDVRAAPDGGQPVRLEVENRHDFTDLERTAVRVEAWRAVGNGDGLGARRAARAFWRYRSAAERLTASCWKFAPSARAASWKTFGKWPGRRSAHRAADSAQQSPSAVKLEKTADAFIVRSDGVRRHRGREDRRAEGDRQEWQNVAGFRAGVDAAAGQRRYVLRHADDGHGEGRRDFHRHLPRLESHRRHGQRNRRRRGRFASKANMPKRRDSTRCRSAMMARCRCITHSP